MSVGRGTIEEDDEIDTETSFMIVDQVKPILAGTGNAAQGAALCTLVGLYLAGHHPSLRFELMAEMASCMLDMCETFEIELYGEGGYEDAARKRAAAEQAKRAGES
jgi:hypothetical protein